MRRIVRRVGPSREEGCEKTTLRQPLLDVGRAPNGDREGPRLGRFRQAHRQHPVLEIRLNPLLVHVFGQLDVARNGATFVLVPLFVFVPMLAKVKPAGTKGIANGP